MIIQLIAILFKSKFVKPEDRFSLTKLSSPRICRFHSDEPPLSEDLPEYTPTVYTCGKCSNRLKFNKSDFIKYSCSNETNLNENDDLKFSKITQYSFCSKLSFLDLYCPECTSAFRVLYELGAGNNRGGMDVKIVGVLENR
jgi:hypothetical protein